MKINNFQIIVILSILSSITWTIRKMYLTKMNIIEFTYIESLFISTLIFATCLYKLGIQKVINRPFMLSKKDILYFSILAIISTFGIFGMHHLLSEEEISVLSPITRGMKTIFISIIGICLLNESVNQKKISGIVMIISGLILLI